MVQFIQKGKRTGNNFLTNLANSLKAIGRVGEAVRKENNWSAARSQNEVNEEIGSMRRTCETKNNKQMESQNSFRQ